MFPIPFVCPKCHASLSRAGARTLQCTDCGAPYQVHGDIPILISRPEPASHTMFDYLEHYRRDSEAFDYFEERTGATAHSERRLREFILSRIPKGTRAILDVGCGSAWIARKFQHAEIAVCSLDVSPVNPQKALERYPSANHIGVAADAYALPFPEASIPCIIASEIIEHVPDPAKFVGEMLRALAPGGALVLSTPYKEKIVYELCIHCGEQTPRNAHLHSFSEVTLAHYATQSGDTQFVWWTFNNKLLLHARSYILLQFLPFTLWYAFDRAANALVRRPANIVAVYRKPE